VTKSVYKKACLLQIKF